MNSEKYTHKILVAHRHVVDFSRFKVTKKVDVRLNLVGYVGRLSEEKGVLHLIEAIPIVLKHRKDTHFMLCGRGALSDCIENAIKCESLQSNVKLMGWVNHEGVSKYLNEIKLLVLPSSTEGLPNILLEAMACGTPILSTSVGAVPDIIKDCETGFLLESNNPTHIADKIIALLNNPELLSKVSVNAYRWVRNNFSKEKTVEVWREALCGLKACDE